MLASQRDHIDDVLRTAAVPGQTARDTLIHRSWLRCLHEHRLDPTRMQEAVILPRERLREHQDPLEDFLPIARHGLESLYQQVAGMGYAVLLTDAQGVTVDFIGDLQLDQSLRRAGLHLGAAWSEPLAGTCAVGTCISTGEALTVHQDDHFDAMHIPLTCTSAPIYGAQGQLQAVLDISALSSPAAKESQHLALQMVRTYAHHVESASFLQRFRHHWVLRLSAAPQFLDVNPDYLLALDATGRIVGHNRRAQQLLEPGLAGLPLVGQDFGRVFEASTQDLERFVRARPSDQGGILVAASSRLLFVQAAPPAPRPAARAHTGTAIPAPLAALSGGDAQLDQRIAQAARLVHTPVSLLLTGETGTGKEYFAKAVHASSQRSKRPFVAVNCAAIPEALAESELFGHLPGSFSGALAKGKRGLVQEADGGTLFLDEIGDMPLALQARLLRVLAEREVLPVGATRPVPVDIRVIAATHGDLQALVRAGRFREDLYYRINGAQLALPPLRTRSDLAWMLDRMLAQGDGMAPVLTPEARRALLAHSWPGNLRELRNAVEFARSVCQGGVVRRADLPDLPDCAAVPVPATAAALGAQHADHAHGDAARLREVLRATGWNVAASARLLGLSRMTLYRRMARWNIVSPNHSLPH